MKNERQWEKLEERWDAERREREDEEIESLTAEAEQDRKTGDDPTGCGWWLVAAVLVGIAALVAKYWLL